MPGTYGELGGNGILERGKAETVKFLETVFPKK